MQDAFLTPYGEILQSRRDYARQVAKRISRGKKLESAAKGYEFFGLHRRHDGWIFREYAPHASYVALVGDFSGWQIDCGLSTYRGINHSEQSCRHLNKMHTAHIKCSGKS